MACDTIRQSFKTTLISRFLEAIQEGNGDSLFLAIAKTTPWSNENSPDEPEDTIFDKTEFWRECIALKKVKTTDISIVIPRYNWASGSVYDSYRDDAVLVSEDNPLKFYVLVDETRIYKCIDNNGGVVSTVKPQETITNIFQTSDGYKWKYIYSLSEYDSKFITPSYIPVFTVTQITSSTDPRQSQLDVQNASINGAIDFVDVVDSGSKFVYTIDGVSSGSHIIDAGNITAGEYRLSGTEVSLVSGVYLNYSLKITDPDSSNYGEIKKISAYDGSTRTVTLEENYTTPTDVIGYDFSIIPSIVISGDGTDALGEAQMVSDFIDTVEMVSTGRNYTYATALAFGGSSTASNTQLDPVMSPQNGHGFNAIRELGADSLMISISLDREEDGLIEGNSDFRQFALISNPEIGGTGIGSSEDVIHSYSVFSTTPISEFSGLSAGDSLVVGSQSGHTGTFQEYVATIGNSKTGTLKILNPTKKFLPGDNIVLINSTYTVGTATDVEIDRFTTEELVSVKDVYRQTTQLNLTKISTDFTDTTFTEDLLVKGSVSEATGRVSSWNRQFITSAGLSATSGVLDIVMIDGGFTTGDTISQFSATNVETSNIASVSSLNTPEIDYHSGELLYLENIQVLERNENQREEIKIILSI